MVRNGDTRDPKRRPSRATRLLRPPRANRPGEHPRHVDAAQRARQGDSHPGRYKDSERRTLLLLLPFRFSGHAADGDLQAIHLQLKTVPTQTITLEPSHPIHIAALETIHTHLTECIDLLSLTTGPLPSQNPSQLAAQLRILSASLNESFSLLKGPPLNEPDPRWQTDSCPPVHFSPPLAPNISVHLGLQESSLVLWLRALEPVDAPQNFGTKLGLALGTVRRLEHDEMDRHFRFTYSNVTDGGEKHKYGGAHPRSGESSVSGLGTPSSNGEANEVFVREKVRVESLPDPNLMSLSAKLVALGHTLAGARRNLAAVMGEEVDE